MDLKLLDQINWEHVSEDSARKIVQIIPALPGWRVQYKDTESGEEVYAPIAFWALCLERVVREPKFFQVIAPMIVVDGFLTFADSVENFEGILEPEKEKHL
jgi:hypothetical protein